MREEALEEQITGLLKGFTLPAGWADELLKRIDAEERQDSKTSRDLATARRMELAGLDGKLQKLLEGYLDSIVDRDSYLAGKEKLLEEKKVLKERIAKTATHRKPWIEPYRKWVKTAKKGAEIVVSGSPQEKKAYALEVFGSNMSLSERKAGGYALKPWLLLKHPDFFRTVEPVVGLEPGHPVRICRK